MRLCWKGEPYPQNEAGERKSISNFLAFSLGLSCPFCLSSKNFSKSLGCCTVRKMSSFRNTIMRRITVTIIHLRSRHLLVSRSSSLSLWKTQGYSITGASALRHMDAGNQSWAVVMRTQTAGELSRVTVHFNGAYERNRVNALASLN